MRANLMAAYGINPPAPGSIIMAFIALTLLFIMIGDLIDKFDSSKSGSEDK